MSITPDTIVFWQSGFITINATIVFSLLVSIVLLIISLIATRKLTEGPDISRWQNLLEFLVSAIRRQIRNMMNTDPDRYLPFLGTLFLFISVSNLLDVVPYFEPPTGSFSATAALAVCVFFSVPIFGIGKKGLGGYFKQYIEPTPLMLPFNIIGELSRTLALAVRLFGNIMSGTMIVGVLISIAPIIVPLVMQILGLLIGQIQAYIFAALATVYIASAVRSREDIEKKKRKKAEEKT